jgi:hypothetical protein
VKRLLSVKRVLVGAVLVLVGFVGGTVFGYRFFAEPGGWLGAVGRSFMVSQYAMTQYREASYPEARRALESYLRYLESVRPATDHWTPGESPWSDARGIRFDKTLGWVRLAMLHEKNGNATAAEAAWRRVDSLAAQGSWKDRSHDHFRDLIERQDRAYSTPVPKLPEKKRGT